MINCITSRWRKKFTVASFDIDVNGRLTLPSLCHYFQEIAWEHANDLNFGYEFLKSINKFWVLSRLQIEVYEFPKWEEEIIITTWPKGIEGMFALRDFVVCNATGTKIAAASSSWLILDTVKHRPQRIDSEDHPKYHVITDHALVESPEKLAKPVNDKQIDSFTVKYSDIDINRHVNNVKYLQWAIDALFDEKSLDYKINRVTINFLGEASIGESIQISDFEQDNTHLLTIKNRVKELCRIRLSIDRN